jgi:hypothetical protein
LAKKYLIDPERAKRIIFTDEKRFCCSNDSKTELVNLEKGENPYQDHLMKSLKI